MYVSAMSVKVREGKNAGTSCEKTSHGRFQQISGENRPRERVSRQISAKNGRESTERACLTADFSKKGGRIDRESASHGRFQQKRGENRPRERVSRQGQDKSWPIMDRKKRRVPADYGRDIGKRQIK